VHILCSLCTQLGRTVAAIAKKYDDDKVFWVWHQYVKQPTKQIVPKTKQRQVAAEEEKVTLPAYPFPEPYELMTRTNLIFVPGHTRNVGTKVRAEIFSEGKKAGMGKARYMAYCSNRSDNQKLAEEKGWQSDPSITLSCIYLVCRLTGEVSGEGHTKEGYPYDWNYIDAHVLETPVPLPEGVKQGVGRYATFPINGKNEHLEEPFRALVKYMNKIHNTKGIALLEDNITM
jgi:hypothetical protein